MPNPTSKRLKQARVAKRISQRQLGALVGFELSVASSRMNQYEKGKRTPDFNTVEKIAKELGLPAAYFYCSSDRLAEIVLLFSELSEAQQDELLEYARRLDHKEVGDLLPTITLDT